MLLNSTDLTLGAQHGATDLFEATQTLCHPFIYHAGHEGYLRGEHGGYKGFMFRV